MKYPILYAKNETDFFSLGLGVMTNTLEASVTEERNGSFYFESKIIIDVVIYPQLENDQLIKVDAGHELKDQRFRIKRIVDNHNGTASIYAEHISYLSAELSLKPEVTVSGNGSTALTIWKSSLIGANSFVVDSDIPTSNSTKWRIDKVQNARQALGGVEGSILEKWGGEYRFDNYHISLLSKRGTTADVLLAYGRNITDFEQERNIANTFNSVYPFAIYTDDKQQEHLITLSGYFVDSSNIASFPNRKAQTVDFSNEFEHNVVPTQDKLKSLAQKYITTNGIGVPSVSIKVSFVDLSKISDYENIAPLEQLNLCDEVHVVYPKLKVNTTAKVVRVVWNVLAESYDEIEIGEKRVSLSDKISEQTKFINEVKTGANAALVSANGKNTNFYGIFGQDGNGEPKATKVGDLWYKPNGDKSELYQWNGTVWSFIISNDWQEIFEEKLTEELTKAKVELDAALLEKDKALAVLDVKLAENVKILDQTKIDLNQNKIDVNAALLEKDKALAGLDEKIADELVVIDTSVKKAQADANTAKTRADDAVDKANASVTAVQANTQLINDVNAIANNAKSQAQTAANNAQTALTSANTAITNANKAISDVGILSEDVLALDTIANQAKSDADTALINANKGITDAKTALDKAIGVDTRVTTEITNVNNTLATKANSTTVDALSDTVSSQGTAISQNATDIKLKADSTVVNAIKGTVDSQGTLISQNSKDIALKANKSSVDTLTGRVSANETAIDVTSQGVSTLVTKTDGTNTALSQFKQDYEGFKGTVYSKTQTDTKISTVQSTVDNFKTTVSNTYYSKSETDSKVTAVQSNVDKIGNYTAYANSADGSDGFTVAYPNLNLLDGTKDFSGNWGNLDSNKWITDGTYKGLTVKKRTAQWQGLYKTFTAPKDGVYTFSAYIKSSGNTANIYRYCGINSGSSNTGQKYIGNNFDWTRDNVTINLKANDSVWIRYEISGGATDSILWNAGHKWEQGSVATPYMPSEKELTSNDIPKYVGYSVRKSENPKDFSWQPYGGLNSYNIIKATTSIEQNSKDIALKANKSEVDTLSGKVTSAEGSISTMAGQIKLKANQTDVDTVKGRVTSAEGSISLISGQVALKANKSEVDTLSGKVSATESSLKIQDGKITALNTKTDGHTTQIGSLQSSYSGFESTISKIQTDVGGKAGKTELSQLSQDLSGFKTTVANTYADKVSVASQITQSATAVTSNVQTWTNNKLTAYSTTQQTSSSITNAVADKADKSQVTQLSNQITSVVESSSQNNLVYNSTLQSGSDGWVMHTGFAQSSARNINGNYIINFSLASNSDNTWYFARSKQVPIGIWPTYSYSASMMRRTDISNSGVFMLGIEGFDKDGKRVEYKTTNYDYQLTDDKWTVFSDSYTFTNSDVKTVCFSLSTNGYGHYIACQPILVNDYKVGSFVPDGMDKSQITQLATDINLRVSKGDIVNQINISPESILIAGNKVQITGQTYIENGVISSAKISDLSASKLTAGVIDASVIVVDNINANRITVGVLNADRIGANTITADKIQVDSLAALSANLGTIVAGFIDASKVVVDKINASRITVGVLSADRIAANSITATHISISSLSALSANLGVITAGTINAATVNIININAGSITTGVLSADRIGANSITADKIKATSLDLFNNDTYTNVRADGMRIQSKAQIVFGNWRDSSNTLRTTQGVYIGGFGGGTKHLAFTRSNGTTFMLRAEQGMDYGTNQNIRIDNLNIYDNTQFWESINVHRDIITSGYIAMGGAVQESSIQYDKSGGTMNFRVPGGRSGSYFWFNQRAISEGSFDSKSKLSLKNVKGDYQGNALDDIVNTNIVEYSYKNDPQRRQLSPIIDDINEIKKYHLPDIINDGESVSLYAMGSLSWLAIKQLAQKLETIEEKLDAIA